MRREKFGPEAPSRLFRMLLSEHATLLEISAHPAKLSAVSPSAFRDLHFLLDWRLAVRRDDTVVISERGRKLLSQEPFSWTDAVVGFDIGKLEW